MGGLSGGPGFLLIPSGSKGFPVLACICCRHFRVPVVRLPRDIFKEKQC
nr:MAG TPA: hypothetical protein [Caudoviricetes sp.]